VCPGAFLFLWVCGVGRGGRGRCRGWCSGLAAGHGVAEMSRSRCTRVCGAFGGVPGRGRGRLLARWAGGVGAEEEGDEAAGFGWVFGGLEEGAELGAGEVAVVFGLGLLV
jgi:hypothetical protein